MSETIIDVEKLSGWISGKSDPANITLGQWRLIETAPKHGGHFWAFQKSRGQYECWWYDDGREAYWMDINDSEPEPTHWMALPASPA